MRPNACMIVSLSNVSPGRAVRNRRMPARNGDCTSDLKRVSRSGASDRDDVPSLARRAEKVTSSTCHLALAGAGLGPIDRRLVLLDQLLHADGVHLAVAVAVDGRGSAARLDKDVGEEQVGVDAD